jgi:hypothetical protein
MTVDDLFLFVQHMIDRTIRRLRLGPPPPVGRRRLLVVQIDGLSRAVLDEALAHGDMPVLRRLLGGSRRRRASRRGRGAYRLHPMTVGLPTSTPAFQMATMYGVQPDIPGFHYHDRRYRTDIHFPHAGHAAFVEATQAGGRPGILEGGSVYGCAFTGGAEHDLFSFARLTRPRGPGLIRLLSAAVLVTWVASKCAVLTVAESARAVVWAVRHPHRRAEAWRWVKKRLGVSVWTRQWFTFAVARDVYDGVPAIYVNYLDHDEAAHAFGPRSGAAFAGLRAVDRSLRQIRRALRRVPEHRYDLYILSDHGQVACSAYSALRGGRRFERAFFDEVLPGVTGRRAHHDAGTPDPEHAAALGFTPYLDEHESWQQDGIRVVSAGPNAFIYFLGTPEPLLLDAIESGWPGLPALLSKSPGVGFVLARSKDGPVCFWRGLGYRLDAPDGPFAHREDRAILQRDLTTMMAMPSAGDLVVYGIGAPEGHVSYIDEFGAHAGPSLEELHTFVVAPASAGLPESIDHPLQLYPVFLAYQADAADSAEGEAVEVDDSVSLQRHWLGSPRRRCAVST